MKLFCNELQLVHTPSCRQAQMRRRGGSVAAPSSEDVRHYLRQLETLTTLIPSERVTWQLEGGMAVALHVGQFLRKHGDVDVAVFADDLHEFEACLAEKSYRLFSRNWFHPLEYAPFDLVRATCADEIQRRRRVKRMMAIKVDESGRVDERELLLPRFDVHVHRLGSDLVYLDSDRIPFPRDLFFTTGSLETGNGRVITVASLALMYFYKLQGRRPRHRFDLGLIERHKGLPDQHRHRAYAIFHAYTSRRSGTNRRKAA
jgi:hypothetical protein